MLKKLFFIFSVVLSGNCLAERYDLTEYVFVKDTHQDYQLIFDNDESCFVAVSNDNQEEISLSNFDHYFSGCNIDEITSYIEKNGRFFIHQDTNGIPFDISSRVLVKGGWLGAAIGTGAAVVSSAAAVLSCSNDEAGSTTTTTTNTESSCTSTTTTNSNGSTSTETNCSSSSTSTTNKN